jgi:hypothetical protein
VKRPGAHTQGQARSLSKGGCLNCSHILRSIHIFGCPFYLIRRLAGHLGPERIRKVKPLKTAFPSLFQTSSQPLTRTPLFLLIPSPSFQKAFH